MIIISCTLLSTSYHGAAAGGRAVARVDGLLASAAQGVDCPKSIHDPQVCLLKGKFLICQQSCFSFFKARPEINPALAPFSC